MVNLTNKQAHVFIETQEKLVFYCERHLENGHEIAYMVEMLDILHKKEPIKPKTSATYLEELTFQSEVLEFENENRIREKTRDLYSQH